MAKRIIIAGTDRRLCVQLCCLVDNAFGSEAAVIAVNDRDLERLAHLLDPNVIVLTLDFLKTFLVPVRELHKENPHIEMFVVAGRDEKHLIVSKLEIGETSYALTDLKAGEFPKVINLSSSDNKGAGLNPIVEAMVMAIQR